MLNQIRTADRLHAMLANNPRSCHRLPMDPSAPDRFVIAATVDRLIYDSDTTFDAKDARTLLSVLPRRRVPMFEFGMRGKFSGGSTRGFAAGHGNVQMDDKERTFDYSSSTDLFTRVGQWKLMWIGRRNAQMIEIQQVMSDVTEEGRDALIRFDLAGTPLAMDIRIERSFRLFWSPVVICIPGWLPWKTPA